MTWNACRPYAIVLAIFASSRFVVYAAVAFALVYVRRSHPELPDVGPSWYHALLRWDAGWYLNIVDKGYADEINSAAFYPLYPLVAKGLTLLGVSTPHALLIVANTAAVIAAFLLFKLVREQVDDDTA